MAGKKTILLICAAVGVGMVASGATIWALYSAAASVSTDDSRAATGISDEARAEAICRRVGAAVIPAADRPTPAQAAQLKDCDAEALYYGQGGAPDYVKARQCAILEVDRDYEDTFSGKTILMQVYANGYGTVRNIDLATALACDQDSLGGQEARVLHLQAMDAKSGPFDVCEDVGSGFAQNACTERDSLTAGIERKRQIDAVAGRFPAAAAPLFADVRSSYAAFSEARAGGETYQVTSRRAAEVIDAQDDEDDQFLDNLTRLADGQWPKVSPDAALAADSVLNDSYRKALAACTGSDANASGIRAEDIRTSQRAWLVYRDAYVKFAGVASPAVTSDAILARLTKLRTAELDGLPCLIP